MELRCTIRGFSIRVVNVLRRPLLGSSSHLQLPVLSLYPLAQGTCAPPRFESADLLIATARLTTAPIQCSNSLLTCDCRFTLSVSLPSSVGGDDIEAALSSNAICEVRRRRRFCKRFDDAAHSWRGGAARGSDGSRTARRQV